MNAPSGSSRSAASRPRRPARAPELDAQFAACIRAVKGDPQSPAAGLVGEMLETCLKLLPDKADDGELKLVARSLKELRYAMKVFRRYKDTPKISIFGSARTPEKHPQYQAAVQFSRLLSKAGWMIITGAGDGIMAAGHGGAGREASFGVSIRLPFETNANAIIQGDPKLITFRYFFTRKLIFLWHAKAVALFPGGFGTHDEGFETLTMVQTGKAPMMPIVMVDEPGGAYWYYWNEYVRRHLLDPGFISPEDLNLYYLTDDPRQAAAHVLKFYRRYHSQRYVRDDLLLRLQKPLTSAQIDLLNGEFSSLVAEGRIVQTPAAAEENGELPDLPRLRFTFTKRHFGRLRRMIDRINEFD